MIVDAGRGGDALPQRPARVWRELGGATGRGVRVAVIDSGWDRGIADPRVLPGVSFVDPDDELAPGFTADDHDRVGHGTACADLVLRVAPDARVVPVRVFGRVLETSPGTLTAALSWALEQGFHVVNVSLGTGLEEAREPLYELCERARRSGVVVVAAGHRAGERSLPADFANVVGVAAERFHSPFSFRCRPGEVTECVAWGVEQPVLWRGGQRVARTGTSFAAPNIAGIVALIRERHPQATLEEVREILARLAEE